jgi:hypothetical protein
VGQATVDKGICAKDMPIINESLLVGANGGLQNVFFYLETKPKGGKPQAESQKLWPTADESGAKLVLDQKNCTYKPHAMIVNAGQPVTAQSQDPLLHSYKGICSKNKNFDLPVQPQGSVEVDVFPKPEKFPVTVSCATHTWMLAYQLPLDHPYGAVTDADGKFSISDLPAGSHNFTLWHEGKKIGSQKVTVNADETVDLKDISISLSQLNR